MNGGTTGKQLLRWYGQTWPQWNPPMNSGTTRLAEALSGAVDAAAMEPADERRDDPLVAAALHQMIDAAMEPADERRDHVAAPRS